VLWGPNSPICGIPKINYTRPKVSWQKSKLMLTMCDVVPSCISLCIISKLRCETVTVLMFCCRMRMLLLQNWAVVLKVYSKPLDDFLGRSPSCCEISMKTDSSFLPKMKQFSLSACWLYCVSLTAISTVMEFPWSRSVALMIQTPPINLLFHSQKKLGIILCTTLC
jgi:hypothetical protein